MIPCTGIKGNTDSTINTNNTDNIGMFCSYGSSKKYKQCYGNSDKIGIENIFF